MKTYRFSNLNYYNLNKTMMNINGKKTELL